MGSAFRLRHGAGVGNNLKQCRRIFNDDLSDNRNKATDRDDESERFKGIRTEHVSISRCVIVRCSKYVNIRDVWQARKI